MTTTEPAAKQVGRRLDGASTDSAPKALPAPKSRRKPLAVVLSVLAIVLGGLIGAFAFTSTSDTTAVLAARTTIERGTVITEDQLQSVQVGSDPALNPIPADERASIVGQRALTDIAAGTLVAADSVGEQVVPGSGDSMVGLSLAPNQMPAAELRPGDRVRIVATPADGGEVGSDPRVISATVQQISKRATDDLGGGVVVDVLVNQDDAAELAARAASGRVALILESRES